MKESDHQVTDTDKLAEIRTELAETRSSMAESRTILAAERTYASWVRTGFTFAGAGWTLATAFLQTDNASTALIIGGILVFLGMFAFIYAWIGFKVVYDYLNKQFPEKTDTRYPSHLNLITVTIISVVLLLVFGAGFILLLIN